MSFIEYNNINIFSGQQTPFFSKQVEYISYADRWCQAEKWNIVGKLTGCNFDELENNRKKLFNNFSKAYGKFNINNEFILDPIEIQSVNIDTSDYIGYLNYNVEFLYYPSGSFSGSNHSGIYGVLDPNDQVDFQESENGILQMNRTISARGFRTSNNLNSAIDNAINFIEKRKNKKINPFFIENYVSKDSQQQYYLESSEQSINRLTNEVSLSEVYKSDLTKLDNTNYINRYEISETNQIGEDYAISYRGDINFGISGNITGARNFYKNFKSSINVGSPFYLKEDISEKIKLGIISYSLDFISGKSESFDDEIIINIKESSDSSLVSCTVNGNISANIGSTKKEKEDIIYSGYNNIVNFNFEKLRNIYNNFYFNKPNWLELNTKPISSQVVFNSGDMVLSYSASFDDRVSNKDYDIKIGYSVPNIAIKRNYNGYHICQKLSQIGTPKTISISMQETNTTNTGIIDIPNEMFSVLGIGNKYYFTDFSKSIDINNKTISCEKTMKIFNLVE